MMNIWLYLLDTNSTHVPESAGKPVRWEWRWTAHHVVGQPERQPQCFRADPAGE